MFFQALAQQTRASHVHEAVGWCADTRELAAAVGKKLWFFGEKSCFHAPRHQQTTPTQRMVECSDVSSMNTSDEKMMGSARVSVPMERVGPLLRVVTMLLPISPPFKRRQQTSSHSSSLHEAPCHDTHHANHHSISLSLAPCTPR
jgi:hypothetical protein